MWYIVSGSEDEFRFPEEQFEFDDGSDSLPKGDEDTTELERALDTAGRTLEENEQYVEDFREITEAIAEGRIGVENVVDGLEDTNDEHRINFARYINATNYFLHQTEDELNDMHDTLDNIETAVDGISELDIPDNIATTDDIPDDYAREDSIDDLLDEIDDVDGGPTNYNIDFTGIENIVKYVGDGLKNIFVTGGRKTEETVENVDRRKFLAGVAGAAVVDYTNIIPGDESAGDGAFRGGECGWDIDGFGLYGEQESCAPQNNGDGTPPGNGGDGTPVDNVQTPYEKDVELSDEDLQYAINNTSGTDQELSNIKNIDGNLNDFGYNPDSDKFYAEVEDGDEETRVEISEEAYWNAVDN